MTYISEPVGLCHLIVVAFENAALMCLLLEMQHHKNAPAPKWPAPISVTHLPPLHQAAYCGFLCNVKIIYTWFYLFPLQVMDTLSKLSQTAITQQTGIRYDTTHCSYCDKLNCADSRAHNDEILRLMENAFCYPFKGPFHRRRVFKMRISTTTWRIS